MARSRRDVVFGIVGHAVVEAVLLAVAFYINNIITRRSADAAAQTQELPEAHEAP